MGRVFRSVTKRVFIIINIVVVVFFLLACLNAILHPAKWWFVAILGLAFPVFLIFVIAFVFFWAIFRSRWIFLSLAALVVGYPNLRAFVAWSFSQPAFTEKKDSSSIRVLSWNVSWFDEQTRENKRTDTYRKEMLDFIKKQDADILCFQEYLEPNMKGKYSNVKDFRAMGYPYHFRVSDYNLRNNGFQAGIAIFSRYPIIDTFHLKYSGPSNVRADESLIAADIKVAGRSIRVFTTHLQSFLFKKPDYRNIEIIKKAEDSLMEASRSILKKLRQGYRYRGDQVELVREQLDESPVPAIICGDFNDVPNSYTYFQIKGKRKDAFIEGGNGLGRTFHSISPTLRIDYIMTDPEFEVIQFKRAVLPYSEHYPIITDLRIPPEKTN